MAKQVLLAMIGGSGLYEMPDLRNTREYNIATPFGKTSAPVILGELEGQSVAFLARHGIGHHLTPSEVPYRANIYALKTLGVQRIVSTFDEHFSPLNEAGCSEAGDHANDDFLGKRRVHWQFQEAGEVPFGRVGLAAKIHLVFRLNG